MMAKFINLKRFLIFTITSFSIFNSYCQQEILSFKILPDSINSFFIGETHANETYFFYRDTICKNSTINYVQFNKKVCEYLIKERKLDQVIDESPVYAEFFLQKYYQTNNPDWLNCIGGYDFLRNEYIQMIDLLKQNNVKIRCIDIPLKVNMLSLKKSLLFILLEGNNIYFNTQYIPYEQLDTLNIIFPHFNKEIYLLIGHLYTRNQRGNIDMINQLNALMCNKDGEYKMVLKTNYLLYKRILYSFNCYYRYNTFPNFKNRQYREKFLAENLSQVYNKNKCSLTILGNSHVANTTPYLYGRKFANYQNAFVLFNNSMQFPYCALISTYKWLYKDDDINENLRWVKKDAVKIDSLDTPNYTFDLYLDSCNYKGYVLFK